MTLLINREAQERGFNLNWPGVAVLILIFMIYGVPEGIAQEPAARPDAKPAAKPPVLFDFSGLQRTTWDIGPEWYSFKYEEPGFMEETGSFYGVRFSYTLHDWVPASPKKILSDGGSMFRAEFRFAKGQVDYDGETMEGVPVRADGIDDFAFEGRLLLGGDNLRWDALNTLYSGIGYRYLNDDSSIYAGGYERESNYLYIPLGYQFESSREIGWSFGFGVEYDFFISGIQRSHLSNVGLYDVDNRQNGGYGYRASIRFQHKSKDAIFMIEPFYRYWDIDESEIEYAGNDYYALEPANKSREIGVQFFWIF